MSKSNPRNITYARVYAIALELFGYDKDKTNVFWMTKMEEFGMSPFEMVKVGQGRKLIKLMQRCR